MLKSIDQPCRYMHVQLVTATSALSCTAGTAVVVQHLWLQALCVTAVRQHLQEYAKEYRIKKREQAAVSERQETAGASNKRQGQGT